MTLGALVDAGCDLGLVRSGLQGLQVPGWTISSGKVWKNGMSATLVTIKTEDQSTHRRLSAILEIFDKSHLSDFVRKNASAIFRKLGEADDLGRADEREVLRVEVDDLPLPRERLLVDRLEGGDSVLLVLVESGLYADDVELGDFLTYGFHALPFRE